MYTTFIADDELIIRQGLRCILDWEELDFKLLAKPQMAPMLWILL